MQISPRRLPALAALALTATLALSGCGSDSDSKSAAVDPAGTPPAATTPSTTAPGASATEAAEGCAYPASGAAAKDVTAPSATQKTVARAVLKLNAGDVAITFDTKAAPCTANSFVSLATQGYFDGTTCHRLTTEGIYVLQCGDPSGTGAGGPGYSFADELAGAQALADGPVWPNGEQTKVYAAGTVAMANSGPGTNGSQFFLVYDDSPLPPNYAVFGTIDDAGLATVTAIADKGTSTGAGDGSPKDTVTIDSATAQS